MTPLDGLSSPARRDDVERRSTALLAAPPGVPGVARRGDALQPARRRQAPASAARARERRSGGAAHRRVDAAAARALALPAACALEMIHTYSLDPRRPAGDGRRHAAARTADAARRARRGHGDPRRRRPAGRGVRAAGARAAGRRRRRSSMRKLRVDRRSLAAAAGAAGMVGGQAIDLAAVTPGRTAVRRRRSTPPALRDMHARKTGALIRAVGGRRRGHGRRRRRAGRRARRLRRARSASPFRSSTTSSTTKARRRRSARRRARTRGRQADLSRVLRTRRDRAALAADVRRARAEAGARRAPASPTRRLADIARWIVERRS